MDNSISSNMMGSSSNSFDSFLTGLLILLVKFLLIALIIIILIYIFVWIRNIFFKNINFNQYLNQNPMMKSILGIVAAITGVLFLIYVLNYLVNPNINAGSRINMSGSEESNIGNFNGTLGIAGVFSFLIKALTYVFIITLIIGLISWLKKMIGTNDFHPFKNWNTAFDKGLQGNSMNTEINTGCNMNENNNQATDQDTDSKS